MSRRRTTLPLIIAATAVVCGGAAAADPAAECGALRTAAERAAAHLLSAQQPSGLFRYGFDFSTRMPLAGDSIVRQAGTAYALAEFYAHARDPGLRRGLVAALEAFAARTIGFADGGLVSADGTPGGARAGATALAMLAELHFYRTSGEGRYGQARTSWERGLRALWRPGEGFRVTPTKSGTSDYFNGEIWLALAYLEATTEEPGLAAWLTEVDRDLMAIYDRAPAVGFYHWGVMAAAERHARTRDERLGAFALRQTRAYLHDLRPEMHPSANTCYAMEGLVTARALASDPPHEGLRTALDRRIGTELAKNLGLQIGADSPTWGGGNLASLAAEDRERYRGAFVAGQHRPFIRIDHTQHCLSALVRAVRAGVCPSVVPAGAAERPAPSDN